KRYISLRCETLAVHGEATVARFILAEAFEEQHVWRDSDDRIAWHQQSPQSRIILREIIAVTQPTRPVFLTQRLEALFQARRHRLGFFFAQLLARLFIRHPANSVLPLTNALEILPIC